MVLPDASLKMSEKDADGFHHVSYRYGDCMQSCFSFNCEGKDYRCCDYFKKLPTGVKTCAKPRKS